MPVDAEIWRYWVDWFLYSVGLVDLGRTSMVNIFNYLSNSLFM